MKFVAGDVLGNWMLLHNLLTPLYGGFGLMTRERGFDMMRVYGGWSVGVDFKAKD